MNLTITISGTAFEIMRGSELYYDPVKYDGGTPGAVSAHAALNGGTWRKRGRGRSLTAEVTVAGAETIVDYCRTVGSNFITLEESEDRRDGRALLAVAQRLQQQLDAAEAAKRDSTPARSPNG